MKLFPLYHPASARMAMMFIVQCVVTALAAQPAYQFENLTEANGLSDNRVTCFFKDRTGFMWIGTENGLNRYDGHSFLVYQPGKPGYAISNGFINDIEQDNQGRLWVATTKGLNWIDFEKDTTIVFFSDKTNKVPSDLIWDTYIDQHDRVWMAPDNRDLCYYDINKNTFHYIPWKAFVLAQFPDQQNKYTSLRKIYYKSDDELWLGSAVGLFSYRISTQQFTWHKSFETDHFIQLETSSDRNTVYFTQNPVPALEILNLTNGSKKDVFWKDIPVNTPTGQQNNDYNNYRWMPAGKQIAEINTVTGTTALIAHIADDPWSLPNGLVRSIYRDNTGLVWVATTNGIGKLNPAMHLFPYTELLPSFKEDNSAERDLFRYDLPIHTVLYSKQDNSYYTGSTATNSLIIKNRTTGATTRVTSIQGIPLYRCSVIFEDSKRMLWILTHGHAFCYDRSARRFTVSSFQPGKRNLVMADMAEDQDGNLWFACFNDGLYRYDVKNGTSQKFDETNGFCKLPTSLYFDKQTNQLLIGTFGYGLWAYDPQQQRISRLIKKIAALDHTQFSLITDITKDQKGSLWMASYAYGIARITDYIDSAKMQIHIITTQDGLPENNVYALQPDLTGNIWATTLRGITKISPDGRIMENYNRQNGLNFTDLYSPFTITPEGEILTGAGNGFIRFHPDSLPYSSPSFPVVLTTIRPKDSAETNSLSYANNEIQFEFAALSYVNPSQTRFEYWLEGSDRNWVDAGHATTARYSNLPPGTYLFKVRAFDFTRKLSSNIATYAFAVRPPWWQTWWFRLSVALVMIGMIYFLFRRRIQLIKNKASIRQQMAELKGQALRAQMNPHFIFNCLNAIQELIVREQYTASYNYLSKFSRLLRMVLDLSEKNFIPLSSEIDMCMLYLELESLRFRNSFTYTIEIDEDIDTETVLIPTLLMQPFIENAIWHGLLQKEGDKKLSIQFKEQSGRLICTIHDNGIGRKQSAAIKAQKLGSQHFHSKGMELARQRIENLHAEGSHDTTIEITDCTDEHGNATGTTVQITISSPENNLV